MAFQAAPPQSSSLENQNFAQPIISKALAPPIFIATFQAAPLPSAINQQTVGYPIG